MSRSHARSPQDVDRGFVHDSNSSESLKSVASIGSLTSHGPHTSRHTSNLHKSDNVPHGPELNEHRSRTASTAKRSVTSSILQRRALLSDQDQTSGLGPVPIAHVHFLSRVRISAGRRRRRCSDDLASNVSSISGSPSSSISAPLRTNTTESNEWGSLGRRVHLFASQAVAHPQGPGECASGGSNGKANGNGRSQRSRRARSSMHKVPYLDDNVSVDEHTRLVTSTTRHSYVENRYANDWYHEEEERERRWREQLIDEVFGKWPARLLNRHWWWWHIEPVLCCFCEPDDE